jgi:spore coat protein H
VLEGEPLSLLISCATGVDVPASLRVEPLPTGAVYDPGATSLQWTPSLAQAGGYQLGLRAAAGDVTQLRIEVLERFSAADNVPVTDPASYQTEHGLPVLHLTTDPGLNEDTYTPAGVVYRGHRYTGTEAKLRGATSRGYPKRSFTVKFTKTDKLSDPAVAGGFNAKRKLTVVSPFDDNSYLRQRLAYELWNRLGPKHVQVQTYSAVLFLNGAYHGLYTFVDHVDGYLMEDFGFNQDGNLFKARNHDANFRLVTSEPPAGVAKSTPHVGYTKEEGMPAEGEAGAYDDLDAFVQWAASSDDSTFVSQIDKLLAREEYESWWILSSFIKADDSSAKNSYHYHDPTAPGGLWHVIPWDFNESFGQDFATRRAGAEATQPEGLYVMNNGLFERMLRQPSIGPAMRARYASVLRSAYALDSLLSRLDDMVREIAVSAHRDEEKWQAAYRAYAGWSGRTDFTSFDEEVQYVRQWIAARHAYVSSLYPR